LNVSSLIISISGVQVHKADAPDANWITVASSIQTFDLVHMKSAGIESIMGQIDLEAGHYTQIRLTVEKAGAVVEGQAKAANVPSGIIKLTTSFQITAGKTTGLTLDFDAGQSLAMTGQGNLVFSPVIKMIVTY
jgi:DUF4097 and DUF4098 domain-containing protein YvlB